MRTFQSLLENEATVYVPTGSSISQAVANSPLPVVHRVYRECVIQRNGTYSGQLSEETRFHPKKIPTFNLVAI